LHSVHKKPADCCDREYGSEHEANDVRGHLISLLTVY
jgi:hypothetical protein